MNHQNILLKNARTHNLKNISLKIPKNKLVVFTGVSGSGKSSLVFDTIYTEAQRQLIDTFSTFARTRMPKLSRPDVDEILNLSTAIMIDQKRMGNNLRSTVGTATEINTFLRLLFSRIGDHYIGPSFLFSFNHPEGMCPRCHGLGKVIKIDLDLFLDKEKTIFEGAIKYPTYKIDGYLWKELVALELFDIHKPLKDFSDEELNKLLYSEPFRINDAEKKLTYSRNFEGIARKLEKAVTDRADDEDDETESNAYTKYLTYKTCDECLGSRINEKARNVLVNGKTIHELLKIEIADLEPFFSSMHNEIGKPIIGKILQLIKHLSEIGVGYLSLDRPVSTLSGGESQKVKMAKQLGCDMVDLMYILDEPSIGLHSRDTEKLVNLLRELKDKGNSVFIVEHDPYIIRCADHVIDIGPKAGTLGGEIVYSGSVEGLLHSRGITSQYLNQKAETPGKRRGWSEFFQIKNASINNLKNVSTKIPKNVFTCVTGVAGSGKSSLIYDVFAKSCKDAITIDQTPIGRSSRSNPATYIGIFNLIRKEFADRTQTEPALFSFNSKGACPKCKGLGIISLDMHFLDEVRITCDECQGKRYTNDVLALTYKNKSIFDILETSINDLLGFFSDSEVNRKMQTLYDVGLGYLKIGQPLSTLSGGEAQRIKLASELHKKGNVYIMDEPTTGLHMADIEKLMLIINSLIENHNTVVVIEHNLDVIKSADWIIDIGPEGGHKGGEIIFEGTPEDLTRCERSYTGKYLALSNESGIPVKS